MILLKRWNAWFYWEKIGICKEIFWIFYEDFLRKFCDFWSSSIEALFFKCLRGFLVELGDFWCGGKGRKWRKMGVLSNSVSNSKWGSRHGWNRCAWFCNRTFVLKCKLCPYSYRTDVLEYAIIVQYYGMFYFSTLKR